MSRPLRRHGDGGYCAAAGALPSPAILHSTSSRALPRATLAIGIKPTLREETPLDSDPLTKPVAIDGVGPGDTGVTVAFDVARSRLKPSSHLAAGVPGPAA